jgi:AraC-like DNA-binding protein
MEEEFFPFTISTLLIDSRTRATTYRKWLHALFDVAFANEACIHSSIATYSAGGLTVALTKLSPAHYARNSDVIKRSEVNNFVLMQLILKGSLYVNFGHKSIDLAGGDIFLMDLSMRCDVWANDCECIHLFLPRSYLHKVVRAIHGRTFHRDSLVGRVLAEHFVRCADLLLNGNADNAIHPVHSALDLIVQCLTNDSSRATGHEPADASKQHILEFIESHLVHPDLDTDRLITEFGISRAKLYRIFAEYGGVQHFIRDKRLDAVLRDICEQPKLRISEAAKRHGFSNNRQFQRAFRAKFGVTARDARAGWRSDASGQYRRH